MPCNFDFHFVQVVGFAVWLLMSGWFKQVEIDFLVAGHTKFSPDRMFGWMSHVLRVSDYFSKSDMKKLFSKKKNQYDSQVVPELLQWSEKLESTFRQIHGIKKFQTLSCTLVTGAVVVVGSTSHQADATHRQIRFDLPAVPLSVDSPILHVVKMDLSPKLLHDLREAQQYVLGSETIEYVEPNNDEATIKQ